MMAVVNANRKDCAARALVCSIVTQNAGHLTPCPIGMEGSQVCIAFDGVQ